MSGMSTVREDTYGCANQYRCDLAIYLMAVLPYSYGIIMYRAIYAPGRENNGVDGINSTENFI